MSDKLLEEVKDIVAENALTGDTKEAETIFKMMLAGLQVRNDQSVARAADMEVALAVALLLLTSKRIIKNAKYYHELNTILQKLEKWQGKSAIQWDSLIIALKTSIEEQ
jgi:hypothetical protein